MMNKFFGLLRWKLICAGFIKGKEISIRLVDVLLREGDQVAKGSMSLKDKFSYIRKCMKANIEIMEVCYPGSSPKQMEEAKKIVDFVKNIKEKKPLIMGLALANKDYIDAVKEAGCDICHIYLPTSNQLMLTQFNKSKYGGTPKAIRKWAIGHIAEMVKYAKSLDFVYVQVSPEDAARTDRKFLCKMISSAISAGADRINIPDTTGLRVLDEFGRLIEYVITHVGNIRKAQISVHCHNDLANADSNATQAVYIGMKYGVAIDVEGNFFGLGERSGMTRFESVMMIILTRRDVYKYIKLNVKPQYCGEIVHFVAKALGMTVPRHWPVVGWQNLVVNSGTHQAIEAKAKKSGNESPYYSTNPKNFNEGREVATIINRSSGKEGVRSKLVELGYELDDVKLKEVYDRLMEISDSREGDYLSDDEILSVVHDLVIISPFAIEVLLSEATGGKGTSPNAIILASSNGNLGIGEARANGTFEAILNAVKNSVDEIYPQFKEVKIGFDGYNLIALNSGIDALGDSFARVRSFNSVEEIYSGRAVDRDTIHSIAQAFANAMSSIVNSHSEEWELKIAEV